MISINNLTRIPIEKKFLEKTANQVLRGEKKKIKELSIALVGQERIRELNKRYRGKNRPTDVLSFGDSNDLAEIVICLQEVKKNANKFKIGFKKELARVLIHATLHLLGYEHEGLKKEAIAMGKKEEQYLSNI